MLSPDLPQLFLKGDKRIVRMFPNYKDIELAYFRKTGIFPIMHVTTIKQEIVDKYPWVPTNLVKAFEEAKQIAYRRIANPRMVPLAWVRTAVEEQEQVLGPDPWAYGLGAGQPQEPRDGAALHPPAGHDPPHLAARRAVRRHRPRRRRWLGCDLSFRRRS